MPSTTFIIKANGQRVCHVRPEDLWHALKRGKALGHIEHAGKGRYRATRPQEDPGCSSHRLEVRYAP